MLPTRIRTATVRLGPYLDDLGSPWTGRVTVRSSTARVWDASGATVHPRPAVVALDEHGGATLRLPTTDQPGFSDGAGRPVTDWSYTVTLELDGAPPVRHTFRLPGDEGDDVHVTLPVATAAVTAAAASRAPTGRTTPTPAPPGSAAPGDLVAAPPGQGLTRRAAFRAGAMVLGTAAAVVAGQQGAAAAPVRAGRAGSVLPAAQTIDDDLVVGSVANPRSLFIRSSAAGGTEGGPGIFDSTGRLVLETYQPHFQHFGESIRVELKDPRAKGMLTYRAAWPTRHYPDGDFTWVAGHPNGPQSVAWLGAHFLNNDDPSSLAKNLQHGHIGFEVPDSLGQLQTRLEIKFIDPVTGKIGTDKTAIRTNMADFEVGTGQRGEQLRIVGNEENHRDVAWSTRTGSVREPRWVARTVAGTSNFELRRYRSGNVHVDSPFGIDRASGLVTVGGQQGTSAGLRVVRDAGVALTVTPLEVGGHGALVTGVDATTRAYQSDVAGDAQRRFVTLVDGTQQWGTGAAVRDTQLYRRAANQLGTDGGIFLRSSATPATASTGGILFVAGGALRYRGSKGTVTTLAPA